MDLETENRIASILLREAAELRRQAEKEGVRAYLEKPNVRHRPNSRFLTATVLGVQQANKAVETDEMWRLRRAEVEFDERLKRKSREESCGSGQSEEGDRRSFGKRCTSVDENVAGSSPSSSQSRNKRWQRDGDDDGKGLGDVEVETFLQSRVKRGRGSVGPKMDEPFPCLHVPKPSRTSYTGGECKLVSQPEKRPILRHHTDSSSSSSSSDDEAHERTHRKRKERKQKRSKRHKSKEEKRDRKEKRREKKKRKHDRD
ncbi:hypothetical protein HID58_000412 [Brassica napus]|uniref:Uncharacterized protein n=1 Tax=Brassica napus TaxID=3708 RepID=A0ABQ8EGJ6_BRANA|nr:protein FAM133 [Brassica napus]KAH0940775.1 hypothetical protein HID58_000412 [Brassica napus]